jgi:oligoribonuclease (3'-5' exoribonuclease)
MYFTIAINATGIDPEKDRLIDIACKCLDNGRLFYQTINPDMLLSTSIMQTRYPPFPSY